MDALSPYDLSDLVADDAGSFHAASQPPADHAQTMLGLCAMDSPQHWQLQAAGQSQDFAAGHWGYGQPAVTVPRLSMGPGLHPVAILLHAGSWEHLQLMLPLPGERCWDELTHLHKMMGGRCVAGRLDSGVSMCCPARLIMLFLSLDCPA